MEQRLKTYDFFMRIIDLNNLKEFFISFYFESLNTELRMIFKSF